MRPSSSRHLDRPDARIHYSVTGRGPAVVLLQGVGVAGDGWSPQLAALTAHHTVVCIDNRGIGRSTAPAGNLSIEQMAGDALAVVDAEQIGRFHLMGHSMGGVIAQHIALGDPSRIMSLALLCTFLQGRQGTRMSMALLWTAIRARVGTRRMRRRAFVEMVMPSDYLASVDRDALCAELHQLFGRDLADQPPIVMRQLRAMARFDASDRLAALGRIPTLVLSATEDRIARPEYGRALAAAIPGARFVEIERAGHAVTIQCAREVNELLAGHLQAASAATP